MTERPPKQVTSGDRWGIRGMQPRPLPNKADTAFQELQALRVEARDLDIEVDDRWPITRLREEIAAAKASRGQ